MAKLGLEACKTKKAVSVNFSLGRMTSSSRQTQEPLPGLMLQKFAFRYVGAVKMKNFLVSCEVSVLWSLAVHSTDLLTFSFPFIVIRHCNLRRQKTRHLIWPQSLREPEHLPRILRLSSPRSLLVFDFLLSCHWDKNFR